MKQGIKHLLSQWYSTPLGKAVLSQEELLVDQAINNLFGYFIVQLESPCHNLMDSSRIQNKLLISSEQDQAFKSDKHYHFVAADLDYLPIGKEKVDVVLLPHTLEVADDPYYLLRQVDRVLLPEGHIVVTGFNPYGCLVLRHRWFKRHEAFTQVKLERLSRIKEWLEVLGYDVQLQKFSTVTCFAQREGASKWMVAIEWVENHLSKLGLKFGNVYCLVAKKRVDSPTLVGSVWKLPNWRAVPNKGSVSAVRTHRVDVKRVNIKQK